MKEENNEALSLYGYLSKKPSQRNKIVLQRNFINFLEKGEKVVHYADTKTVVTDNHIAILSSNNCLLTEKRANDDAYRSTLFFFNNESLSHFFIKYEALIKAKSLPRNKKSSPVLVLKKDEYIKNYIAALKIMLAKAALPSAPMLQLKFEELMLYLLEAYPQEILTFNIRNQVAYSDLEIKRAVEENITNNLSLSELAFLCHTSISTFKRKFQKLYNTSPSQYFIKRKMEMAATMLSQNENRSEIFYKVGYENHSSFSHSFKQVYGISPKRFQQQKMGFSQ